MHRETFLQEVRVNWPDKLLVKSKCRISSRERCDFLELDLCVGSSQASFLPLFFLIDATLRQRAEKIRSVIHPAIPHALYEGFPDGVCLATRASEVPFWGVDELETKQYSRQIIQKYLEIVYSLADLEKYHAIKVFIEKFGPEYVEPAVIIALNTFTMSRDNIVVHLYELEFDNICDLEKFIVSNYY